MYVYLDLIYNLFEADLYNVFIIRTIKLFVLEYCNIIWNFQYIEEAFSNNGYMHLGPCVLSHNICMQSTLTLLSDHKCIYYLKVFADNDK